MARKQNPEKDVVVSSGAAAARPRRTAPAARPKHSSSTAEIPSTLARAAEYAPSHEEIATLAYTYWLERGCQGGSPEEDWQRAEQELRIQASATSAAVA
jgi:hypothetical protein